MGKRQTAVEWLIKQIKKDHNKRCLSGVEWMKIFEQAKKKERDIIEEAYTDGMKISIAYMDSSDYYDNNYKS